MLGSKLVRCILLGLPIVLLLAACGSKAPKPGKLRGDVVAAEKLNPDPSGRNSPVYFYVFQLKSGGSFESADFYTLYQSPEAVLGDDLLDRQEFLVRAGQTISLNAKLDPATAYLGFLAAFRDLDRSVWRVGRSVRPGKTTKLQVRMEGVTLSIPGDR